MTIFISLVLSKLLLDMGGDNAGLILLRVVSLVDYLDGQLLTPINRVEQARFVDALDSFLRAAVQDELNQRHFQLIIHLRAVGEQQL